MRSNYCAGGGDIFGGQLPNLNTSTNANNNFSTPNNTRNGGNTKVNLGSRRQQFHESQSKTDTSSSGTYWFSTTTTTSPFIVYRSAKYDRPHARALQTLRSYAKYYILGPVALVAYRCKDAFYLLCGLLLLLVTSPLWTLMILGLFIVRRLRFLLIQRLYPGLVQLNNNHCYSTATAESLDIVNSIIWTKRRVDPTLIKKRFQLHFTENPSLDHVLKLRTVSKLGATFWETSENFDFGMHIVEAPKRFRNCPNVDEPLKELYRTGSNNKTILQKYVSHLVSTPLDHNAPPWKIHVVPYISREEGLREKTCLVIRMHVALMNHSEVQRALRELFMNCPDRHWEAAAHSASTSTLESSFEANEYLADKFEKDKISRTWKIKCFLLWHGLKETVVSNQKYLGICVNLRLKQLEFHSKTVVLSILMIDIKDAVKRFLANMEMFVAEFWSRLADYLLDAFTKLQAFSAVPMIILLACLRRAQFKLLGLQKNVAASKRLISWSDVLHGDLMEEICEKTGILSTENVMLMACSYALSDYYQQNNMPNPRHLGFAVENAYGSSRHINKDLKVISLPSDVRNSSLAFQKLKCLEEDLRKYPAWKSFGFWYISKYASLILPSFIAQKLQKWMATCFPFCFAYINLKPNSASFNNYEYTDPYLPIRQLYGELVEDFTIWSLPPLSDYGISITLVQYTGKTRLFVMSPFQSLDTVLTQRCNQYLIKLAEDVGVERSRIPYSRRTSPLSTACSTPQPAQYINPVNNVECRSVLECKRLNLNGSLNQ